MHTMIGATAMAILLSLSSAEAPTPRTHPTASSRRVPTVRLIAFLTEDCDECEVVDGPALKALGERTGAEIEARYLPLAKAGSLEALQAYEKYLGKTGTALPVVVIGKAILHGRGEIEAHLETLVRRAARDGGIGFTELPAAFRPRDFTLEEPSPPERWVYVAYFYRPGCRQCRRIEHVMSRLHARHANIILKDFDISDPDNKLLLEALNRRAGVPRRKRLATATVFVNARPFVAQEATLEALEKAIQAPADRDMPPPWEIDEQELTAASTGILDRFREMSLWTVMAAGLFDGVNPCAFATIVFLVAYLAAVGKQRREVLACGAAFTLGVFATYLAVGVGLKVLLETAATIAGVGPWLYRTAATFCLAVGLLSLADYVRARRKGLKDMKLVLPKTWRVYTRSLIARSTGAKLLVPVSVLLGATISLVELACTGQVYLPTIVYVIGTAPNSRAYGLLILYNVVFVLPLVAIFALIGLGLSSRRLAQFSQRHLAKAKLALAAVFVLLGTGLLALSVD